MTVSIIIPVYNGELYLAQAIDSCLNQSYRDIEIVIVDDGSTDNTATVVEGYKQCSNVTYIFQNNAGLVEARRTGVKSLKNEFFVFLDADDILEHDAVSSLVEEQIKGDYDVVFADFFLENESGKLLDNHCCNYVYGLSPKDMINNILSKNVAPPLWGRLMRKRVFMLSEVPSNMTIGEDAIAWIQIFSSEENLRISYISNRTVHYIQHGGSMVNVFSEKKNRQRLAYINWIIDFMRGQNVDELLEDNLAVYVSSDLFSYIRDGGNINDSRLLYSDYYLPHRNMIKKVIGLSRCYMIELSYKNPPIGELYRLLFNKIRGFKNNM